MKINLKDLYDFNRETGLVDKGFIKVNSKNGFQNIESIDITAKNSTKLNIKTTNFAISTSPKHLLYKEDWIKSDKLLVNDYIDTINGYEKIISIVEDNITEDLYDIQVVGSEFYANGIRSHNSSFQQSFDFSIFGIVRGKNSKRVPQSILPNRINKNLETEICFLNNLSNEIKIRRSLEPTSAQIFIDNQDETKKFKNYKKEERDKIIGFDYETYKSFISLSVSDFANFIDLSPEEKRNIINKLFNLQDLDNYLTLSNGLIKQLKEEKLKYEAIIETNNQTINSLNQNIINIKRSGLLDKEKEIKTLENEKLSKKEPYIKAKEEIQKIESKLKELETQKQDLENQKINIESDILEIKVEIRNIQDKLEVYKSGICPVCESDLTDSNHKHNLDDFNKKYNILNEKSTILDKNKNEIILKLMQISNQKDTLLKQKNTHNITLNNIIYELKNLNKRISELKEKTSDINIEELLKNIEELKEKNIQNKNRITQINDNIKIYEELKEVFSNKGVRKNIIKNIIKPINVYLSEILKELNSTCDIKIDEEFTVKIYERLTQEIHPESLSNGESKKINIAIALSYIKLILKFRKLNVLFLDEVFSSMSVKNVDYALKVLKGFTREFNLNVIILDPEIYFNDSYDLFDRVIKVSKKLGFSNIKEESKI